VAVAGSEPGGAAQPVRIAVGAEGSREALPAGFAFGGSGGFDGLRFARGSVCDGPGGGGWVRRPSSAARFQPVPTACSADVKPA